MLTKSFLLSFALLSALFSGSSGQDVKVYKGGSRYNSDVICTVKDSKVYKKTSIYSSDVICNIKGNRIYKGNGSYSSDVLYNI